ncbi:MAG: hypothetical protein ACLSXO_03850 [Coprococcus sp.]
MWRNRCINDTYEPESTLRLLRPACLEAGVVKLMTLFNVRISDGGGSEDPMSQSRRTWNGNVQGVQNSCNPVFIDIGLRLGVISSASNKQFLIAGSDSRSSGKQELSCIGKTSVR